MSSELGTLYTAVKAQFVADGVTANVVFGRREPMKQINQGPGSANRVVFMPGGPTGDMGDEAAPRFPGQTPRAVKDTIETFTAYVWGHDASGRDELKQYEAAKALYNQWRRDVFNAAEGRVTVKSKRWLGNVECPFGAEIEILCTIRSPVYDAPPAGPDAVDAAPLDSDTTVTELGQSDHVTT